MSLGVFFYAGLGKTTPDPSASVTMDGVEVPLGTGISSGVSDTCLLYNEYPFTSVRAARARGDVLGLSSHLYAASLPVAD